MKTLERISRLVSALAPRSALKASGRQELEAELAEEPRRRREAPVESAQYAARRGSPRLSFWRWAGLRPIIASRIWQLLWFIWRLRFRS